jgi:hypothetical protein
MVAFGTVIIIANTLLFLKREQIGGYKKLIAINSWMKKILRHYAWIPGRF